MLNKAQIIGRVGRDPEMRYLPSGEAVASFTMATSERWKDKATGEMKEATEWHNISTFGRLAEIVGEYVKKGGLVYVEGKITTRKYEKDGVERYATSIKADTMKLLSGKEEGQQSAPRAQRPAQAPRQAAAPAGSGFDDMDDDIPF